MTTDKTNEDAVEDAEVVEVIADTAEDASETPQEVAQGDVDEPIPAVQNPRQGRSPAAGFVALLLGGVLAGTIGFAIGRFDQTAGWIFGAKEDVGPANAAAIEGLTSEVSTLRGDQVALTQATQTQQTLLDGMLAQFATPDQVAQAQDAASQALATLEQRVVDLENRPIPDVGATQDAVAAYERELAAMREMFQAELTRIQAAQDAALDQQSVVQSQSRNVAFRSAVTQLENAARDGQDMTETLAELTALNVAIPPALETHKAGIPSRDGLASGFPQVARAVLEKSIDQAAASGELSALEAFVKKQVGARSLTPRDGDDADAVLARAEAKIARDDLSGALEELQPLTALDVAELSVWMSGANTQINVQRAISALSPTINE